MKKNPLFWTTLAAVLCLILAVGASLLFNEGRWVYPMDLSDYRFRLADLPMLLAVPAAAVSAIALICQTVCAVRQKQKNARHTRKLNPWLGLLGFFGLLGFLGLWTYRLNGDLTPFCFFVFFGFFGFFLRGKCPIP